MHHAENLNPLRRHDNHRGPGPGRWALLPFVSVLTITLAAAPARSESFSHAFKEVNRQWHGLRSIAQTEDGFLWIGTEVGLFRHDGSRFVPFHRKNTPALPADEVNALTSSPDGALWIGLAGGTVVQHRQEAWHVFSLPGASEAVSAMAVGPRAEVWAVAGDRLFLKAAPATAFTEVGRLPGRAERLVAQDGMVFALLDRDESRDILEVDARGTQRTVFTGAAALDAIDALTLVVVDTQGRVWRLSGGRAREIWKVPGGAFSDLAVTVGPQAHTWVAGGGSLYSLEPHRDTTESARPIARSSRGREPAIIYADRADTVWLLRGVVLSRLSPRAVSVHATLDKNVPIAFAVEEADDGIWYSGVTGLVRVQEGREKPFEVRPDFPAHCIRSLARRRAGGLWLASCTEGLMRLENESLERAEPQLAKARTALRLVLEGRDGAVWMGPVQGGLLVLRGGDVTTILPLDETCVRWQSGCPLAGTSIEEGPDGTVWFATEDRGLFQIRPGPAPEARPVQGLPSHRLLSLHADVNGDLWIGTKDVGLLRLHQGKVQVLDESVGVPSNAINGVVSDEAGRIWIATAVGVSVLDPARIAAVAEGREKHLAPLHFDEADGMASARTSDRQMPSALRARDGRMWFPTHDGAVAIEPVQKMPAAPGPPVLEVSVDGGPAQRLDPGNQLETRTGVISIHFVTPHFQSPHRLRSGFKLEGFDRQWGAAGQEHVVRYDRLPRGDFTFRLRVGLNHVDARAPEWTFQIRRRGWMDEPVTWTVFALALAMLLLGVHHVRIRRAQAAFKAILDERNRIARDLHDGLAQGFAAIGYQLERTASRLPPENEAARTMLEKTHDLLMQCRIVARQTVWDLRVTGDDSAKSLVQNLRALCDQAALASNAVVNFQAEGATELVPDKARHEMVSIAREALTNALVHGRARHVELRLSRQREQLQLTVTDDGSGFDPVAAANRGGAHFGLKGMQERAASIGGKLTVTSAPGQGTRLELVCKAA